jgi:hypothetical protein
MMDDLRARIRTIESDVISGSYRPGAWTRLLDEILRRPRAERAALSDEVSRTSRALHRRHVSITAPVRLALALEIGLAALGAIVIALAGRVDSNALGAAGALAWITAFQPLVKFATGRALGIEYDYVYLLGPEPRFKMKYGSYVAAPRWLRVLHHLSGTLGSPLGALLGWAVMPSKLGFAHAFCVWSFWALVALNVVLLTLGLCGVRRVFGYGMTLSSGGAAARELREGVRLGDFS